MPLEHFLENGVVSDKKCPLTKGHHFPKWCPKGTFWKKAPKWCPKGYWFTDDKWCPKDTYRFGATWVKASFSKMVPQVHCFSQCSCGQNSENPETQKLPEQPRIPKIHCISQNLGIWTMHHFRLSTACRLRVFGAFQVFWAGILGSIQLSQVVRVSRFFGYCMM